MSENNGSPPSVLITGATSGIGKACTKFLADKGWIVFAGYRRPEGRQILEGLSENIRAIELDVTDEESIRKAAETIERLDGLINNAGVAVGGPVECLPVSQWEQQLNTNVLGVIRMVQAFLPAVRQAKGRVINISSIAGVSSLPYLSAYSASKFAVEAISDALRMELKPWDVKVCLIQPGSIDTPIWAKSLAQANENTANLSETHLELYGEVLEQVKKATVKSAEKAMPVQVVVDAVFHALSDPNPKTRYLLGREAQLRRWLTLLPDGIRDELFLQKMDMI